MNEALIQNWNETVSPGDVVYHLGDFAHCCKPHEAISIRKMLNGKIVLIIGSHDRMVEYLKPYLAATCDILHLKPFDGDDKMSITLCHHPFLSWPCAHYGTWHLFGHHHGNLRLPAEIMGKSFDCGVDCWDYKPISLDRVIEEMKPLHNGFNYISPEKRRQKA